MTLMDMPSAWLFLLSTKLTVETAARARCSCKAMQQVCLKCACCSQHLHVCSACYAYRLCMMQQFCVDLKWCQLHRAAHIFWIRRQLSAPGDCTA